MKIVYSKINESRNKFFQIATLICKDEDGTFKVVKKGLHSLDHILNVYNNTLKLKEIYGETIVEPTLNNDELIYPFVKGKSLDSLFFENQNEAIALYKNLILKEDNIVDFEASEGFNNLFKGLSFDKPLKAFKLSNIDLIFSNILSDDGNLKIIDAEWVFDFSIPVDYLIYRAYKELKTQRDNEVSFDLFKNEFNISLNEETLESMDQCFLEYVGNSSYLDNYKKESKFIASALEDSHKEVDRLNGRINELSSWGTNLNNELNNERKVAATLREDKLKLDAEKEAAKNKFKEAQRTIKEKDRILKIKDDIIKIRDEMIDERDERIKLKDKVLDERENKINELDSKNNDLQGQVILLTCDKNEDERLLNEIMSSRVYKIGRFYYKIKDFLLPPDSKRKTVLKVMLKMLRHPIWTIRHLNGKNITKFFKYSSTEGFNRAFERIDIYHDNNVEKDYSKDLDLYDMKDRENYEVLTLPKEKNPVVSIVIPVYNQFSYTYGCLESIIKNTQDVKYEVLLGDDCSNDLTVDIKKYVKNIKVCKTKTNLRFVLNCNNAAKSAKGKYIFFLNNDTNVQPKWLSSLVELIESDEKIGMVGSKLVYPTGALQEAGGILWKDGSAWNYGYKGDPEASEYNYVKEADYVSGAAIMIRNSLWKEIGGFDERYAPAYCEDSDLAFEVRKRGYKLMYNPFSVVVHYEGISNGTDISSGIKKYQVDNTKKFYEKWKDVLSSHYPNAENVFIARERSYNKPCILMIDHYVPQYDKDAGSRTIFQYLKLFASMGYNVKFMGENFYRHEPYTSELQKMGIEVLYYSYYANHWKEWLDMNGKNFDYVFFNRPHITIKFIDDVERLCPNAKFIYYGHDLHYMRLGREYEINKESNTLEEANKWRETEETIFKKVDLILYPSQVEVDEVKKNHPDYHVEVLQPYLIENVTKHQYLAKNRKEIMFVGGFRHSPNFDAVNYFINEVYPHILEKDPNMVLNIVGSYPPQELIAKANDNIVVKGFVSDEELNLLYSKVKLIVVPLRYGAGIKGKVIEAMANNVPVLTTSCGAEGINSDSLIVDDTLLSLNDLYNDDKQLETLSEKEYKFISDEYSFDIARTKLEKLMSSLNKK